MQYMTDDIEILVYDDSHKTDIPIYDVFYRIDNKGDWNLVIHI